MRHRRVLAMLLCGLLLAFAAGCGLERDSDGDSEGGGGEAGGQSLIAGVFHSASPTDGDPWAARRAAIASSHDRCAG